MTDNERAFYLLLCMSGRTQEATEYKEKVESKEIEEERRDMFRVYIKSAGGTKKYFTEFETEAEAESFCREYGWEWVDENEFVWDMDYEEA